MPGDLVKASNIYVINDTPDYVPAGVVSGITDLGVKLAPIHGRVPAPSLC